MPGSKTQKQARRMIHVPSIRSLTRKECPPGMALRRGYLRKYSTPVRKTGITVHRKGRTYKVFPSSKSAYVKGRCVKSLRKATTRGPARFGPLRKGELKKLGYSSRLSDNLRHTALRKAVVAYGALGVYRKLDAVAKLSAHTIPTASAVYVADREWIRKTCGPLKAF
jgi:hypothetical protein